MRQALLILWLAGVLLLPSTAIAAKNESKVNRAISFNLLQQHAERCADTAQCPGYDTLFGLTRVVGVVVDEKANDLILVGQIDPDLPSLHTEDLVVTLRNAWMKYAEREDNTIIYSNLGCSIDPDPQVVARLHSLGAANRGSESPVDEFLREWRSVCKSPQEVRVLGMPFNTRFARVLVKADYDMKRLADGSDSLEIEGFTSLSEKRLDEVKAHAANGSNGSLALGHLNRFEFIPKDCPFHPEKGGYFLDDCPVQLVTEEEHLRSTGKITGTGKANPLAQQFCDEFTRSYGDVARKRPIYAELEGLFRFAALAKIIHHKRSEFEDAGVDLSYYLER